eukprot:10624564-Alexandrium_andersonii.AAC.1
MSAKAHAHMRRRASHNTCSFFSPQEAIADESDLVEVEAEAEDDDDPMVEVEIATATAVSGNDGGEMEDTDVFRALRNIC